MPEFQLTDSIITQLNAQEPWPDNVKLFQPYEVEQILLPDNASCLAVQAFLKMCNLPFEVEMRWNAEFMSPSGRVPFIKCGAFVVSELEPIVQFAANKGVTLCAKLSTEEKAEMRAYMSLITNVLVNAELYISWVDNDTFNAVTKVRNSSVYPWPLGWLQTRAKRNAVIKRLKALHWYNKTLEQVLADVEQCCNSLSQRLGDKDYFFGSTASPLDALLSGHIRAMLSAEGVCASLFIKHITNSLLRHMLRVVTATQMKLTPQEEYLVTQAFQVTKRRISPDRTSMGDRTISLRSSHTKKSRMSVKTARDVNREIVKDKDTLTFQDGAIICTFNNENNFNKEVPELDEYRYKYVASVLDEIIDKVEDLTENFDDKHDSDTEKSDYEVIPSPNSIVEPNYGAIEKVNDYLDTIEENDVDTTGSGEDVLQIINDDESFDGKLPDIPEGNSECTDYRPSELDALVFGHVFTIITTRLPCRKLAETVRKHETLVALAKRVDERYFKRP